MNQRILINIYCIMFFPQVCYGQTDLLSLLQEPKSTAPVSKKTVPSTFNKLFDQIGKKESNPAYQKALAILNDQTLSAAYQQNLFDIELLLNDYATQILQKYRQQNRSSKKQFNFVDLLHLIAPKTTSSTQSGVQDLSSLLALIQPQAVSDTKQMAQVSLLSLVSQSAPQTAKDSATKSDMLHFLQVPVSQQVAHPVNHKNMLQLLSQSTNDESDNQSNSMLNLLSTK